MGDHRLEHTTASSFVARLESRGLTPEKAGCVAVDGTNELADVMIAALDAKLGIAPFQAPRQNSLAARRRAWWKRNLKRLAIKNVTIPIPNVSDDEINRRAALRIPQKLFFNHFTSQADYDALMQANGQDSHWTLTNQNDRNKINWEFSATGYWFWAEVPNASPRLKIPWNTLSTTIRLLSLEEYVIVWHTTKAETQVMLDGPTYCWLRTRYNGSGALRAGEDDGGVVVSGNDAESLSGAYGLSGGRLAEVVVN